MLTHQQVEQLLDQVLSARTELDEVECKPDIGNALQHALCAMSNRRDRNGGVVFVGVDRNFRVVGVPDIERAQQVITDWASDVFNVPLRVIPELLEREGHTILAVIVPPCPPGHRPCHFKRDELYDGSWIRVGNSTRLMTKDEVRREIAADEIACGTVLPFDMIPYLQAPLDVLDDALVSDYIERIKEIRPVSQIESLSREGVLRSVYAVAEHEDRWYPTPAGLLFFCREPQRYLPQSSVEFLHLWGPELTSLGPDGSRWRLNREILGTLPQIIDQVETLLLERIATRGIINSFRRHDEPEYPRFALRESIVNAVAHRDYTLRGSRIQVRLFPDRLEIYTPGGLPPPVTVDNIEDEQATRNEAIVNLLQDFHYMERRGYGFNGIVAAMREAGLSPPLLRDDGSSFGLCLKSHVLMSPEALEWLKQFEGFALSPQERLALVYLRVNERLYNRDYVRLTDYTSAEATQALRRMVDKGVLVMHGTRGGAYYTLSERLPQPQPSLLDTMLSDEERVLQLAKREGRITAGMCIKRLQMPRWRASKLLQRLATQGVLQPHGKRRGRYYTPNHRDGS
jgi:ATP-dependent DNA helicase RecG